MPFYVMERVEGEVIGTVADAARFEPEQRRRLGEAMVDVLAALHTVDVDQVGLSDWGKPTGFLERQLLVWRRQWDAVRTRERPSSPTCSTADPVGSADRRTGVVHGDFKLDNMLVDAADPGIIRGRHGLGDVHPRRRLGRSWRPDQLLGRTGGAGKSGHRRPDRAPGFSVPRRAGRTLRRPHRR